MQTSSVPLGGRSVRLTSEVHAPMLLQRNPYIAGKSLSGDCGFFGRQDIFELVRTELSRNAIVLFGQRRIGKTSILKQLQRRLEEPFLPVYFDLMDRAEQPMGQLLTDLAQLMALGAGLPELPTRLDDAGLDFRQRFLPDLYQALGTGRAMVLLLDEFDVLDRSAEQQLPATAAARAFFPYLRKLIETEKRLHFLVVIGRKTEELSSDFKATFKAARFKRVSVLSPDDARQLVTLAERDGSLRFAPGVVEAILELTTGHPYLIQLMCQQLWDAAHSGGSDCPPIATHALLAKVVPRALEAGQNVFEWIWDGLPPAERVVLAAIAEATQQQAAVTEEQVLDLLQRHGVRVLSGDLDLAPRKLVDWELLRVVQEGYRCHAELLRRWVLSQKPLLRVKDEVYRLNPLAERLFLSARDFYALNQPVKTQDHLVEVLQINPGHLPARLLLARLLRERGHHTQAVQELERAWLYDEAAARMPLVGALLAAAESHERRNESELAVQAYERAITLSAGERIAVERLTRLRCASQRAAQESADIEQRIKRRALAMELHRNQVAAKTRERPRLTRRPLRLLLLVLFGVVIACGMLAREYYLFVTPVLKPRKVQRLSDIENKMPSKRWEATAHKANPIIEQVPAPTRDIELPAVKPPRRKSQHRPKHNQPVAAAESKVSPTEDPPASTTTVEPPASTTTVEPPASTTTIEPPVATRGETLSAGAADEILNLAQTEYINGNLSEAISTARSVLHLNKTRAWRIIGAAACNLKDLKLANEAFRHLDTSGRQYLIYTCQRQGIFNSGSQFRLAE